MVKQVLVYKPKTA